MTKVRSQKVVDSHRRQMGGAWPGHTQLVGQSRNDRSPIREKVLVRDEYRFATARGAFDVKHVAKPKQQRLVRPEPIAPKMRSGHFKRISDADDERWLNLEFREDLEPYSERDGRYVGP